MKRRAAVQQLAELIDSVVLAHPTRVAVDGVDGAGKTHLAQELSTMLASMGRTYIEASIDGFHRSSRARHRRGRASPDGYYLDSFDLDAVRIALLKPLGPGGSLRYRRAIFDHRLDRPVESAEEVAPPDAILMFDGIFLHRPELVDHWDLSIFVEVSLETGARRAMRRDAGTDPSDRSTTFLYRDRYMPAQHRYLETVRPRERADAVFVNEHPREPELSMRRGVG